MAANPTAPLFAEAVPALPVIGPRSPFRAVFNALQDFALDVVGCRGSARRCEREFEEIDHQSDLKLLQAEALAIARGQTSIALLIREGIDLDHQERTPLQKHWRLFDEACEAGRQIVGLIERLPGMRRRPASGRGER